ncbi:MAG: hypothetical protein Q8R79_00340, partial [Legionellaceae bacterium]|nr:hypothetical protein [Legionellaceae bacterium]
MEQVLTEAATSAIPDKVMSLWHRFTKSKESLTRTEHITCFNALYGNLKTFCSPEMNHSLPPKIAVCWSVFNFEVVNALDYHFTNMVDLQQLLTTVRQENTYTHPVTTSILSTFDGINALASSETKTLVQVTLGYVAAVAIELARIEDSTQQTAIIVHLERVITTLHANTEYRNIAGEQVSKALNALLSVFKDFLTNHQAKERIERITNAVKAFLKNQIELVTLLLQVLLIATEGGNKQKLTFDCVKIKKGELTNADNPARFNPSNPFQPLISYTAGWIPNLHGGQNSGQEPLKTLELPTIEVIQNFLATALNHGFLIKEQRVHYGDDTVLYLLERSNNTWITKTDAIAITQSAKQLHRLADWLRFHLYIADKLYHLNILLIMQGQAWFAQGAEATFIQLFIQRYNTLFQKFTNEIGDIHTFLSDRAGSNVGPEHNIFYTFNKIEEISKTLQENALTHLLKVQEHFSSIRGIADESRQRFFSDLTFFLNDSGYQFELPPYEEILSNPLTIMPLPQTSTPVQLQCTTVSTHFTPTEKIKHILESYAYQHGYTFKLDNIADEIRLTPGSPNEFQLTSSHSGETHEVRAQWILECLKLFTPEKTVQELLEAMAQKIKTLQLGLKKYSHFKSKLGGKTDIEKCIEEIITEIEKSVITKPTLPPNGSAPANSLPTSAQNAAASPTTTSSLSTNSVSNSKEPSLMPQSLAPSPVIQPCNQTSKGYHRHRVPGDGDCGYTAYGITREAAYSLLKTKKADSSI